MAYALNRKETRWKRNRKLGDVYGGRRRPKFADNVVKKFHDLNRPAEWEQTPILFEDNPSRDFYFPISATEARDAILELPELDTQDITHIWCRRVRAAEWRAGEYPWAQFIYGRGVHLIVLYAWPVDRVVSWKKKPSKRLQNELRRFGIQIFKKGMIWQIKPTEQQLRHFYVQHLLYHEVGHHVDWFNRQWSRANTKKLEEYANLYAIQYTSLAKSFSDQLGVP